jgi:hypothetical protein
MAGRFILGDNFHTLSGQHSSRLAFASFPQWKSWVVPSHPFADSSGDIRKLWHVHVQSISRWTRNVNCWCANEKKEGISRR